jgi:hypothetical protein
MSTDPPQRGRIRVITRGLDSPLPVEIRDRRMRLVDRRLSARSQAKSQDIIVDPGIYTVSVRLPGGRQLAEAVEIQAGGYQSVDLTPEPESLYPRVRYTSAAVPAGETPPAEQAGRLPDWAARFVRLRGLSRAVPDPTPHYSRRRQQLPGLFTFYVGVPRQAVVFIQLVRSAEVPLNVALPAGDGHLCLLTVEERAGVLYAGALPFETLSMRAAQYLAAGEEEHAGFILGDIGEHAEAMLFFKSADPIGAAIGGYILLRLHELERTHHWTENLAAWFKWLPDGAVIAGEKAAMLGDHLRALDYFLQAGKRGLPLFTDGFAILISRLRQYQTNAHIHAQLTDKQAAGVRALSGRLEKWSPFVDFSALTLTFRAAVLTQPTKSQHHVEVSEDLMSWE